MIRTDGIPTIAMRESDFVGETGFVLVRRLADGTHKVAFSKVFETIADAQRDRKMLRDAGLPTTIMPIRRLPRVEQE